MQASYGSAARIQLNDAFAEVSEIQEFIATEREARDEKEIPLLTTSLKVDQDTKMGIVSKVKQELREVNALKISYSTREKNKKKE